MRNVFGGQLDYNVRSFMKVATVMSCTNCFQSWQGSLVNDARTLYNPILTRVGPYNRCTKRYCDKETLGKFKSMRCGTKKDPRTQCRLHPCNYKKAGAKCGFSCGRDWRFAVEHDKLRLDECEPWFNTPEIREEWTDFLSGFSPEANKDSLETKCLAPNYPGALSKNNIGCNWWYPEADECSTRGFFKPNKAWDRFNENRMLFKDDFRCINRGLPVCEEPTISSNRSNACPPYLGDRYGARYFAWGRPSVL